jgi:hypothetical protein
MLVFLRHQVSSLRHGKRGLQLHCRKSRQAQGWRRAMLVVVERAVAVSVEKMLGVCAEEVHHLSSTTQRMKVRYTLEY